MIPGFLTDACKFGINLGLDRMIELDRRLGNPQDDLKVIHVAGTNGKGSTVSFISSCLAAAGLRVGVYTSPFLERFSERMRIIDGPEGLAELEKNEAHGEITDSDLLRISNEVKAACEGMVGDGFEHPTEFELVTAICYMWFKERQADIVVLETGLGGRLDSTNVIREPVACVITSIGLDHQDRLGDTIDKITGEKAGIFKPGVPVFAADPDDMLLSGDMKDAVRRTLVSEAQRTGTEITFVSADEESAEFKKDGGMTFEYEGKTYETGLAGRHQVLNASLAIRTLTDSMNIPQEALREGITATRWKGRAELISTDPPVILDGGHNAQCAQSLMDTLARMCGGRFSDKIMRVVIGVMKDKNVEDMIRTFKDGGLDPVEVYTVRVDNPRSMDPAALHNIFNLVYNTSITPVTFENAREAVTEAYRKSLEDGIPLLVTGSLYLIGEVRGTLCTITENLL